VTVLQSTPQAAAAGVPPNFDEAVARLRDELGEGRLVTDAHAAAAYAGDYSAARRPAVSGFVVALPQDAAEVATVLRTANAYRVPVVTRGAGTGLSGGANAAPGNIVLSTERLNRILEISPEDEVAVVEPGLLTGSLNKALLPFGLFYAPDPASSSISSIGGSVATNAGGLRCAKYGVTRDAVLALEVVLADGSTLRTGHGSIRGVTGLDLTGLFVGSEGVLGVIVSVTVRLRPVPVERSTLTVYFDSIDRAAGAINRLSRSTARPTVLELFDRPTLENIDTHSGSSLAAGGGALLLIEVDGYGAAQQSRELLETLAAAGGRGRIVADPGEAESLWELRRSGRGESRPVWAIGEEIAVPKSKLGEAYRELARIGREYGVEASAIAHAWDGTLHPALVLEIPRGTDSAEVPANLLAAADDLISTALRLGGTISGEHGIGLEKRQWLPLEPDRKSLDLQHQLKAVFDPNNILNPGKAL
jgi:glycolate oxidase